MKKSNSLWVLISLFTFGVLLFSCEKEIVNKDFSIKSLKNGSVLTPLEQLGKEIFFDENLSVPVGMSCAVCHGPETGFTGPDSEINSTTAVYSGVIHTRTGNRKPPSAAYAGESPVLYYDETQELWIGGMFWDGRATGWTLDDPLAEQAQGPFLNPLEQNVPGAMQVLIKIKNSDYAYLWEEVWGPEPISWKTAEDIALNYERVGRAVAAYERSLEVSQFSSKYDAYLAGNTELSAQEKFGLELFEGKAMCSTCHPSQSENGNPPLFTDFSYTNTGIPKNPSNPFYMMPPKWNPDGMDWIDAGLGDFLKSAGYAENIYMQEWGKHKVPTLRNVAKVPYEGFVKAYMHNGVFKSLSEVVHFYNTRDVEEWPSPEVETNVNTDDLGNLGLTQNEENAIVAFLKTLSDSY